MTRTETEYPTKELNEHARKLHLSGFRNKYIDIKPSLSVTQDEADLDVETWRSLSRALGKCRTDEFVADPLARISEINEIIDNVNCLSFTRTSFGRRSCQWGRIRDHVHWHYQNTGELLVCTS